MKLKMEELPKELQPLARMINRLHAMSVLVRHRAFQARLAELHKSILSDLYAQVPWSNAAKDIADVLERAEPQVVTWMKHANTLRVELLLALKDQEAAGRWFGPEVDLREHQADGKPTS